MKHFVDSLSTAWRDGEVRPTHRKPSSALGLGLGALAWTPSRRFGR